MSQSAIEGPAVRAVCTTASTLRRRASLPPRYAQSPSGERPRQWPPCGARGSTRSSTQNIPWVACLGTRCEAGLKACCRKSSRSSRGLKLLSSQQRSDRRRIKPAGRASGAVRAGIRRSRRFPKPADGHCVQAVAETDAGPPVVEHYPGGKAVAASVLEPP